MYLNSYSFDNIEEIYNIANKKGQIKKKWFLGSDDENNKLIDLSQRLKDCRAELKKENSKKISKDPYTILKINNKLELLKEKLTKFHKDYTENATSEINKRTFKIEFETEKNEDQKYLYSVNDLQSFIASKILMVDIKKIYKTYPEGRDSILKKLSLLLRDPFPKMFLRVDIKSFYESIPNDDLMNKIRGDALIPSKSQRLLRQVFYKYNNSQNNKNNLGIPRGLSFSPYLAELYMKYIDNSINSISGVYFYARYVDDIVILAVPNDEMHTSRELFIRLKILFSYYKLELHTEDESEKTYLFDIPKNKEIRFDYLGYNIQVTEGKKENKVQFYLTDKKVTKYKEKIEKAFDIYLNYASSKPKIENKTKKKYIQPLSKLYKELQFLTGNYRLSGTKNDILSGVYFKHRFLSELTQLKELDEYLKKQVEKINDKSISEKMFYFDNKNMQIEYIEKIKKHICDNFSFEEGYKSRRMHRIPAHYFRIIKRDFHE